jgi:hypothetical protein
MLKNIIYKAGWAPVSVVLFHSLLSALIGHRRSLDPAMHFLGGAAIAYFFYKAIAMASKWFGEATLPARPVIAFCFATTIAVFWEFMEFTGGKATGVSAQVSLEETMYDLILGCSGALTYLLINGIFSKRKH